MSKSSNSDFSFSKFMFEYLIRETIQFFLSRYRHGVLSVALRVKCSWEAAVWPLHHSGHLIPFVLGFAVGNCSVPGFF